MSMQHYDIVKVIGKGTFGRAILCRKKSSNRHLIIKQVTMSQLSQKEKKEALNEVNVLRQLSHPHIIKYRKSFEEHGKLCIVMDYAENGDLYQKIRTRKGKLFDEEVIMKWFVQIALALEYTHAKHILHRDLKTQNIFLSKNNDVLLGDFGIARVLQSTMECARTMVGTPYYLSPELCREEPYNHKSDVWSLGCILYELATHRHAFEANSMKGLVGKILRGIYPPISSRYSSSLKHLIDICLQKDVRKRPSVFEILKMDYVKKYVNKYAIVENAAPETAPPSADGIRDPAKGVKPDRAHVSRPPSSRSSAESRPESRNSHQQQVQHHKRYADPPQFSEYHENKAAEIKARIMKKYKREQEQLQQQRALEEKKAALDRKRQQIEFMEQKRKQIEVERHLAQQRAHAERERINEERRRDEDRRIQQQELKRERDIIYEEQQQRAEIERRKIWQENRAAAMRNKQRLYDHMYGGADVIETPADPYAPISHQPQQISPDPQPNPHFSVRPEQQDAPSSQAHKQQRMNEEELAEFRKKQFWEAKIQAMKNRQRVLDQLYGESAPQEGQDGGNNAEPPPDVVISKAPPQPRPSSQSTPHYEQDDRLSDIQRRRKHLEEEIARKERDLLERKREFEEKSVERAAPRRQWVQEDAPYSAGLEARAQDSEPPPDKFLLDGKTLKISSTSSRDSLCYRIEALRLHLEKELGLDAFVESYDLLQSQTEEDDDNELNDKLLEILGEDKLGYVSLIHQLIVCEESFNECQ